MDSSRFHILCQDEFLGFEQNDENGENFLGKREKEKLRIMAGDRGAVRRSENMGFEAIGNVRWRMKQPVGRGYLTTPKLWNI